MINNEEISKEIKNEFLNFEEKWKSLKLPITTFEDQNLKKAVMLRNIFDKTNQSYEYSLIEHGQVSVCSGVLKARTLHLEFDIHKFSFVLYINNDKNIQKLLLKSIYDNPKNYLTQGCLLNYSCLMYVAKNGKQMTEIESIFKAKPRKISYYINDENNRIMLAKDFVQELSERNSSKTLHYFVKRGLEDDTYLIGKYKTGKDISLLEIENQKDSDDVCYEIVDEIHNKDYDIEKIKFEEIQEIIESDFKIGKIGESRDDSCISL